MTHKAYVVGSCIAPFAQPCMADKAACATPILLWTLHNACYTQHVHATLPCRWHTHSAKTCIVTAIKSTDTEETALHLAKPHCLSVDQDLSGLPSSSSPQLPSFSAFQHPYVYCSVGDLHLLLVCLPCPCQCASTSPHPTFQPAHTASSTSHLSCLYVQPAMLMLLLRWSCLSAWSHQQQLCFQHTQQKKAHVLPLCCAAACGNVTSAQLRACRQWL